MYAKHGSTRRSARPLARTRGIARETKDFPHITDNGALAVHARRRLDGRLLGRRSLARLRAGRRRRSAPLRGRLHRTVAAAHRPTPTITILASCSYPSAIKAWSLTGDERYREAAIEAAVVALAAIQSEKAGFIPGWGFFGKAGLERLGPRRHPDEPAACSCGPCSRARTRR